MRMQFVVSERQHVYNFIVLLNHKFHNSPYVTGTLRVDFV